jgi:hypothetical protein
VRRSGQLYLDYDNIRQAGGEPAVALLRELVVEVC